MASDKTIREVVQVLENHLTTEQIQAVLADLQKVEGNKSFRDTINALIQKKGVK